MVVATVTCTGGLFLSATDADTLLAQVVVATVTCTGGLFLSATDADTLLAQVAAIFSIYIYRHHHHTVQVTISQPPPPVPVEYLRQLVIEKDHQCKLQ